MLLLQCIHEIPGQQHNHDNYCSAITAVRTRRQLWPAMRNGRQNQRKKIDRKGVNSQHVL